MGKDLLFAWRSLRHHRGLSAVIVLTLALAIGANTAIFSLLDSLLLRALPVRDPQSLLLLEWSAHKQPKGIQSFSSYGDCQSDFSDTNLQSCSFSMPFFQALRQQTHTLASVAAYAPDQFNLSGYGPAVSMNAETVSGGYFSTLGLKPLLGRFLTPGDDSARAPAGVVLGYTFWQRQFGGAAAVVGTTVEVNRHPVTIVGVAPKSFPGLAPGRVVDAWLPLAQRARLDPGWTADQAAASSIWLVLIARIRPGVSLASAQAEVNGIFHNTMFSGAKPIAQHGDGVQAALLPAQSALQGMRGFFRQPLLLLMWIVGAILLIACANIAGLLLGRAHARHKELALRRALGAGGWRIARQLLTESLLLSFCGGVLGLGVAWLGARALRAMVVGSIPIPVQLDVSLDGRVLLFTLAVIVVTGLLFGLAPAWRGARGDLSSSLKDGLGNSTSASGRRRLRWLHLGNLLVVAQLALCMVILAGAGLLLRTMANLRGVDPGFNPRNLLLFDVVSSSIGYQGERTLQLYSRLQQRLDALPGVHSATYASDALVSGGLWMTSVRMKAMPNAPQEDTDALRVGLHYYSTLGMRLLAGRDFRAGDFTPALAPGAKPDPNAPPTAAIVSRAFVNKYLGGHAALGTLFGYDKQGTHPRYVLVGVVSDAKFQNLTTPIAPALYVPLNAGHATFELRTAGDPLALLPAVRKIVHELDANLPVVRPTTEEAAMTQTMFLPLLVSRLTTVFAVLALLLAAIGLYGLLAQEVGRRTREIGIRMALGAERRQVLRLVVGLGLSLAAIGIALGWAGAWASTRALKTILFGIQPGDPVTLAAVGVLLLAVAILACWIPARRATQVDPLVALRAD